MGLAPAHNDGKTKILKSIQIGQIKMTNHIHMAL